MEGRRKDGGNGREERSYTPVWFEGREGREGGKNGFHSS